MIATFDAFVHFVFMVLLNGLWETALIALLTALILRLTPQTNATTRSSVLTAALLAAIILPIATSFVSITPAGRAPSLQSTPPRAHATRTQTTPITHRVATVVNQPQPSTVAQPSGTPFQVSRVHFQLPRLAVLVVVALWFIASIVTLTRLVVSLLHLERLKHDALPLDVEYRSSMARWSRALKGGRGVRLCRSPEIVIPIAVGLFDAMILIPETLIEELTPDDVDRIVLHELAHLRRGDDWVNALERIAQSLLFFNPGIQWIVGQLDLEREVVCDDWVLQQTAEVRQYATCLARVAEITAWPYRAMAAPGAFVTRRSMSVRIERLLEAGRDIRIRTSFGPASFSVMAFIVLCVVAGYVSPSIAYSTAVADGKQTGDTHRTASAIHSRATAKPPVQIAREPSAPTVAPTLSPTLAPSLAPAATPSPRVIYKIVTEQQKTVLAPRTQSVVRAQPTQPAPLAPATQVAMATDAAVHSKVNAGLIADANSPDYIDELASVGYHNLTLDQLIRLKSVGVTAQFVRDLEKAGIVHPSVDELTRLAAVGVDGAYIGQMRSYFPGLTADDLAGMKAVGVTGSYIDALRAAGYPHLSVDDVRSMSAVGVDTQYIRDMRSIFGYLSPDDLRSMRAVGVTRDYVEEMRAAGLRGLTADDARKMRALGIDSQFIRDAATHGFRNLTIDQLIRLKTSGIL